MTYNISSIRQLLNAALSDEDLSVLCYDFFRPVYDQFAVGMSRAQKIQRLIEYCERYEQFDRLLAKLKDLNPKQYQKFASSLTASSSVTITPSPSSTAANLKFNQKLSPPRIEAINKQLALHRRRLELLKERQAVQGLNTPPEVSIEIEDIEAKIEELEAELSNN